MFSICSIDTFSPIDSQYSFVDEPKGSCINSKFAFWDSQVKGCNIFNQNVDRETLQAAKQHGIQFIRLAPDKFASKEKDFLLGDADNYQAIAKGDLEKLKDVLNLCAEENLPVVLTMLSLPGSRWKQNNDGKDDLRIWSHSDFQRQAAEFWKDLAQELKDHQAIIGYNILNEPHPERLYNTHDSSVFNVKQETVQIQLHNLYEAIITSIRSVDSQTPIVLDSSGYADPGTFTSLKPHKDPYLLYSFHMYEPYSYTNKTENAGRYSYPGSVENKMWDTKALEKYMEPVFEFQNKHKICANQILVGEFGAHRTSPGIDTYFKDLTHIFNKYKWHFAVYAFREDTWDGMDYELGDKRLPGSYWEAIEKGEKPNLKRYPDNPTFKLLRSEWNKQK